MTHAQSLNQVVSASVVYLPYELERNIFELAAEAFPGTAVKLALVSSYVREWIEAIIYRIVVLDRPFNSAQHFLRTFHSRPRSFFAKHVKHLYITSIVGFHEACEIVSSCESAQTVACWTDARPDGKPMRSILPTHTLRRLSIKVETLFGYTNEPGAYCFLPEDYPQLTHLEIVNPPGHNSNISVDWGGICRLPSLTHLSLGDLWPWDHTYLFGVMEEIFRRCPSLQLLVVMSRDDDFISSLREEEISKNPRFLLLPNYHWPAPRPEYWATIRSGGPDVFDNAEKIRHSTQGKDVLISQTSPFVAPSDVPL